MRCIFRLRYRSWLNFSGRCFRIGSHIFSYSFQISREPFLTPSRNSCSFIKRRWLEHLWLLYVYRSKRLYYKLIHMHSLFSSISGQKSILHTYVTYIHRFLFLLKDSSSWLWQHVIPLLLNNNHNKAQGTSACVQELQMWCPSFATVLPRPCPKPRKLCFSSDDLWWRTPCDQA